MDKETRLKTAIALSLIFMLIEVVGGYLANSIAIFSDAAHLLTDIAGFGIALVATLASKAPATKRLTFGFARAEVFGALASVLSLWVITFFLLYAAYDRAEKWYYGNAEKVNGFLMFIVACFGVLVNLCLGQVFHQEHGGALHPGHSHEHHHHHEGEVLSESDGYQKINHSDVESPDAEHDHDGHEHDHGHDCSGHDHSDKKGNTEDYEHIHDDHDHDHAHDQHGKEKAKGGSCSGHDHTHHATEKSPLLGGHDHSKSYTDEHSHDGHDHDHHDHDNHDHHGHHDGHDHHGGHLHESDVNIEAAYLHVITDLIQSVGVAIAGVIMWKYPNYEIIDPVCTLIFSIIALYSTLPLLSRVFLILFEGTPTQIDWETVMEKFTNIPGVDNVHDLHIWNISSTSISLTCHMRASNPQRALKAANDICRKLGIHHTTIQVHNSADPRFCYSETCDHETLGSSFKGNPSACMKHEKDRINNV
eukprot:CAMPEP_0173164256 /NCGR_PEP_ID=MMETSP1105-20130129/20457_1 /TAXON_ID=2985 /ORGANISM="Ochromonas sp., Strain BG-1" /LENGTH=474 /DNA_ID=CAMNT_0014084567 /DNA_START=64 /DNA_END=1488 /DNA_ORIENTATION=+